MKTEEPRIGVRSRPDATLEQVRGARARAWAFVFERHQEKAAGTSGGEGDPKGVRDDRAEASIPPELNKVFAT